MRLFGREITIAKAPPLTAPVPARGSGGWFGIVRESFPGAWQRNVECDSRDGLLAFGAVYACVNRIASDIAKLRIRLVRLTDDGIWIEVDRASPFWPVLRKPNRYQTRIQFFTAWLVSKLLHGNAYILKERDARGIVTALYVLDATRVLPLVSADGGVYYQIGTDVISGLRDGVTVPASEVIHDRCITPFHPLVGVSPIYACGASATQGNRIQANSARFFENMSRPSGVLTAPGTIDTITADRLKAQFEANFSGGNLGRLLVAGDGLKYEAMTIPATDAQLIEQLQWTVADVARAYSLPLYKIGAGPMPTNNNVEALQQQYYDDCLQVYIEAIELLLDEGLGIGEQNGSDLGTEFDLDGLMRMDTAAKIDAMVKAAGGGLIKPDEGRRRLNLPPVEGGDACYLQQQNYSLSALARRDARDDPFAAPAQPPAASEPEPDPEQSGAATDAIEAAAAVEMQKALDIMKRGFANA